MARQLLLPRLERPTRELALRFGNRELDWQELARACAHYLVGMRERGIGSGDRVALWARPSLEAAVGVVGNLIGGIVTVPLNPKLGEKEREHILGDADPALVLDPAHLELSTRETSAVALPEPIADETAALIIYTSGTTGPPKGAVLSHRNVTSCLDGLIDAWQWTERDVVVHALPIFHVHGLVLGVLGSLRAGGAMWGLPRFEIEAVTAALLAEGTMLFGVPTMYHRLARGLSSDPSLARALSGARMLVSGSAPLAAADAELIREHASTSVFQRYGLTETLINCAARYGEPVRSETVGPPLRGIELKIVDEDRVPVPPGELGEIAVRGDNVFVGYLNRPAATAAVIDDDDWFYTGDIGSVDPYGVVSILGRASTDLIKTGGYKVGAGEVEACLAEHPGVVEVAVVGVSDVDLGERIVAFVVFDGDRVPAAELSDWVATRLSPHKRPREIREVESLPRNALGKLQKTALLAVEA